MSKADTDIAPQNSVNPREWWTTRVWFSAVVTIFCLCLIAWLAVWGNPANVIHQGMSTSSFLMIGVILAGFGIGAVTPDVTSIWKKS